MNTMLAVGFAGCVIAGVVAFTVFHMFYGIHGSLSNARIGEVYNFVYEQPLHGMPERFLAKVLDVHVLTTDEIARLNRKSKYRHYDANFVRTKHLVTAQTFDGKIRNFYAERTRNVRRPLLGRVAFKSGLASLLF